jgi:large subunit ribosomal protein L23
MSKEALYSVIKSPVVSEKSMLAMELNNQYVFLVDKRADKTKVKQAIEAMFNVKVSAVNILNQKGKEKRTRFKPGKRSDVKKAYVTLADGHSIEMVAAE